jgi:uncharacterized protein YecT (DUF1311 family)
MMSLRDRTNEILEIKQRDSAGSEMIPYNLSALSMEWQNTAKDQESRPDFYLIRAVTMLEVVTRRWIAKLIDHSKEFTERAVELSKNFKMDFATVRDIQGRAITLGDIVSHSVPVNTFGQILDHFEILIGKPLRPLLSSAVDRWRVEIENEPPETIISDFDVLANHLGRLFKIRHILCHELPAKPVYSVTEVDGFLDDAAKFTKALGAVLNFEQYGLVPLTQTAMNIEASEKLTAAEEQLNSLLATVRAYLAKFGEVPANFNRLGGTWLSCFNDAQEKWLTFRNAHCDSMTYLNQGGTIRNLLWALDATKITEERISFLRTWLEHESVI